MLKAFFALSFALMAGCADVGPVDDPEPGTTQEEVQGGTACGPNGLVCSSGQQCCVKDPRPPAPAQYSCISKHQTCTGGF
jgi:hypothetical protein